MNHEKQTQQENKSRNIKSLAKKAGAISLIAASAVGVGANVANAAPAAPEVTPKMEKQLNSKLKNAAYRTATLWQRGPHKVPGAQYVSFYPALKKGEQIVNQSTIFGDKDKRPANSYSLTVFSKTYPNGEPNLHTTTMVSLRAGNNTSITIQKNWDNKNWTFEANYRQKGKVKDYEINSAVHPEVTDTTYATFQSQLTPYTLSKGIEQMEQIIEDAQNGKPVGYYPPAFEHPQTKGSQHN